ncbi:MAG: response regulator [Sulfurimonas sp.]|nr:response regulator [Sulfurimonas sp.]
MKILEKCNVLLLEDDKEVASAFIETLELYFKTIYFRTNIKDALETIRTKKIDVIMSDIHLEKENGLDFITTLKSDENNTPIVILSGF